MPSEHIPYSRKALKLKFKSRTPRQSACFTQVIEVVGEWLEAQPPLPQYTPEKAALIARYNRELDEELEAYDPDAPFEFSKEYLAEKA